MSSLLQSCWHRKSRKISEQSIDICCFCCILSFAAVRRAFERWTCSSNLIAYVVSCGSNRCGKSDRSCAQRCLWSIHAISVGVWKQEDSKESRRKHRPMCAFGVRDIPCIHAHGHFTVRRRAAVAQQAHNLRVGGSTPPAATISPINTIAS